MAKLKLSHIYKVYDNGHKAVNDFSIDIEDKEFIVFVGPSGCGKSTTLRMIAGLEKITAGDLFIGDVLVNDMMPKDRDIAMVFQNYALYPHMTVYENMAFGLRNRHVPEDEIKAKVEEAARILDITDYLQRKPKAMSGGQRQRVALGRAIVREPKVFLLDEPLSNLDAKLRAQMRTEISRLHKKLQTTFIYVTHDQVEAMTMGTRIVVMKLGYVQQIDTPMNLYNHPYNKFVAGFIGTPQMNFYDATLTRDKNEVLVSLPNSCSLKVSYEDVCKIHNSYLRDNKPVIFGIRPEHLQISDKPTSFYCRVSLVEHLGNECIIYGELGDNNGDEVLTTGNQIIIKTIEGTKVEQGDKLYLKVDETKIHLFDKETEVTLINDIPDFSRFTADVEKGKLDIFNSKKELCPVYAEAILDHKKVFLDVPPSAIVKGNDFHLPVRKIDKVGDQYLAYLAFRDRALFALVDSSVKVGDEYNFSLLYDKIRVLDSDANVLLEPIHNEVSLIGRFEKVDVKEVGGRTVHFLYNINGYKIDAPQVNGFKVNQVEGNACYKKEYRYVFDRDKLDVYFDEHLESSEDTLSEEDNVSLPSVEGIKATVTSILDYGNRVYAYADANGQSILINYDHEHNLGDVILDVKGEDISINQIEIDMRIC